jgi:serine/threonine protein kinase
MSPEQALAQKIDQRTDIFSLGVMFYEMVTGERPFQGVSSAAIYDAILHRTPVPVTDLLPDLPNELQWIIEHALEKDRELRFQTASDLKAALKTLKRDSGSRQVTAASRVTPQPLRPKWIPKAVIAFGVVLVLVIAGYLLWSGSEATKAPTSMRVANFTQLTTAPGQEIYPSLSPDGKLLVYASAEAGNWDIYSSIC